MISSFGGMFFPHDLEVISKLEKNSKNVDYKIRFVCTVIIYIHTTRVNEIDRYEYKMKGNNRQNS